MCVTKIHDGKKSPPPFRFLGVKFNLLPIDYHTLLSEGLEQATFLATWRAFLKSPLNLRARETLLGLVMRFSKHPLLSRNLRSRGR